MADRPFLAQSSKPNDESLQAALGPAYGDYRAILGQTTAFARDWTFTRTAGWLLKIHDRTKALLYLIPLNQGFRMSMAIRESEREAMLRDPELVSVHQAIASARKYPEGFALAFDVDGQSAIGPAELLITKLIAERA
ncbi:MAG TPA: DUF3788 family protein [Candidatus Limnocylindrales bacterium]